MKRAKNAELDKAKNEKKKSDDPEAKWSIKRIGIFLTLILLLLFIGYYFIENRVGQVLGERDVSNKSDSPQIELPDRKNIDNILKNAEESISDVNANDIVSSQPQIQNAIHELEKLTSQDNFRDQFCSSVCGK